MLTHKKWNVQISVFVQGGPKASGVWILVPFQKFWVRHILKPKLPLLAYKALGVWFLTSLSTLHSHHVPPSSGPLALYLSSSVQSRMPSCALSLCPNPHGVVSFSSFSSLFRFYLLREAILISHLKNPSSSHSWSYFLASSSSHFYYQKLSALCVWSLIVYYVLTVCVPPKFVCWSPVPQGDGVWRWALGS